MTTTDRRLPNPCANMHLFFFVRSLVFPLMLLTCSLLNYVAPSEQYKWALGGTGCLPDQRQDSHGLAASHTPLSTPRRSASPPERVASSCEPSPTKSIVPNMNRPETSPSLLDDPGLLRLSRTPVPFSPEDHGSNTAAAEREAAPGVMETGKTTAAVDAAATPHGSPPPFSNAAPDAPTTHATNTPVLPVDEANAPGERESSLMPWKQLKRLQLFIPLQLQAHPLHLLMPDWAVPLPVRLRVRLSCPLLKSLRPLVSRVIFVNREFAQLIAVTVTPHASPPQASKARPSRSVRAPVLPDANGEFLKFNVQTLLLLTAL
jgi:hypothetical protein